MALTNNPYRAIPQPQRDLDSVFAVVSAMKENIEIMQGLRGPRGIGNQVFVGPQQPAPLGTRDGDLWVLQDGGTWVFKVWSNGQWT